MNSQLHPVRSALCGQDVIEYLTSYFPHARRTLFIGNLGFSPDTIFSPGLLAPLKNVDFRFLIEQRPDIPKEVNELAEACEVELRSLFLGANAVAVAHGTKSQKDGMRYELTEDDEDYGEEGIIIVRMIAGFSKPRYANMDFGVIANDISYTAAP